MIIRGDFGALASEARRLDDVADRIEARLVASRREMDDFLASGWTGEAASRFGAAFERWSVAADECEARLRDLIAEIRAATDDLAAAEGSNAEVSQTLTAQVPEAFSRMMGAR